jgi:hypothetical protein
LALELSVGCALTAPLQTATACLPETLLTGCGTARGTVFVPVVPVVDGAVVGSGVLVVAECAGAGLAGAVAGRVAVGGRIVVLVGAAAVLVGALEDVTVLAAVDSLPPPQPLMSAPLASPTISDVDSLGNMILPRW